MPEITQPLSHVLGNAGVDERLLPLAVDAWAAHCLLHGHAAPVAIEFARPGRGSKFRITLLRRRSLNRRSQCASIVEAFRPIS
jgi:hypothetical protein